MRQEKGFWGRMLCALLAIMMVAGSLVACSGDDEVPDGYQYATCRGEYFRLFVPTQWTVNTESGVSGAYISVLDETAVSMAEVHFEKPAETGEGDGAADTTATLEDFYEAHLAEIGKMKNYTSEKTFDATLGSYRAKDITYTATVGTTDYRYRQVLTKVQGRFYLFTFSSHADAFEQWLDIVDEILENVMFYANPYDGGDNDKKIPAVDNVPAGMKLVSDNDVPYRFFAPNSWVVEPGSAASLVYASETDRSNVSVIGYVPDAEGYSVADYWAMTEESYMATLEGYTLLYRSDRPAEGAEAEKVTMGGKNATVFEYTYTLGGVTYRTRQTICVFSYMIVVMTYTALPENYEAHLDDVLAMQEALTFRKPVVG